MRTESKNYRRMRTWNGCLCGVLQADLSAGPVVRARRQSIHLCISLRKKLLHAKREAHVSRNPELATHERDLPIELAGRHVYVVLRAHRNRDARRGGGAFLHRAGFIVDDHVPFAAVVSSEIELVCRIEALGSLFVETTGHRRKNFFRGSWISHGKGTPLGGSGVRRFLSAI